MSEVTETPTSNPTETPVNSGGGNAPYDPYNDSDYEESVAVDPPESTGASGA